MEINTSFKWIVSVHIDIQISVYMLYGVQCIHVKSPSRIKVPSGTVVVTLQFNDLL